MNTLISCIIGGLLGFIIGIFVEAILSAGSIDDYQAGFEDGREFEKNKNFNNNERRQ